MLLSGCMLGQGHLGEKDLDPVLVPDQGVSLRGDLDLYLGTEGMRSSK